MRGLCPHDRRPRFPKEWDLTNPAGNWAVGRARESGLIRGLRWTPSGSREQKSGNAKAEACARLRRCLRVPKRRGLDRCDPGDHGQGINGWHEGLGECPANDVDTATF